MGSRRSYSTAVRSSCRCAPPTGAPAPPTRVRDGSRLPGERSHPLPAGAVDSMATSSLVSVDEYLSASYRPDCDYVDGVLLGRNVGRFNHATFAGGCEQIGCAH